MTQMYECDCGARYSSSAGVEACAMNYHGRPNPHIKELEERLNKLADGVREIAARQLEDVDTAGAGKALMNLLAEVGCLPRSGG